MHCRNLCNSKAVRKLFPGEFNLIRGVMEFGICHLQLFICFICYVPSDDCDVTTIVLSLKLVLSTCANSEVICEVSHEVPDVLVMWTYIVTCRCVYMCQCSLILCVLYVPYVQYVSGFCIQSNLSV